MEDLLDTLKDLIPTVIIISGFLLPVFLKKKKTKEKAGRGPAQTPKPAMMEKEKTEATLEDKIRKYFKAAKEGRKDPQATVKPKPAPRSVAPTTVGPRPAASKPSVAEPAVLSSKKPPKPLTAAPSQKPDGRFAPIESMETAPQDESYAVDTAVHKEQADAYAIDQDVHHSRIELEGVSEAEESLVTLRKQRKPLSGLREKAPRVAREKVAVPAGIDWEETPPLAEMNSRDLKKAIILREVLGPPVGLRGAGTDLLW